MTRPTEEQPEAVPARAKRAGEILRRWGWVEPTVWTERMLTALEQGVKGGKWFSLIDKVHPERTLRRGVLSSRRQPGSCRGGSRDGRRCSSDRLEANLKNLSEELRSGHVPAAADPPALHPQTGEQGEAAAGDSDGARPGGSDGVAEGAGTDLRARLRRAQLRLSPRTGLQRRTAPGGRAAQGGLHVRRRCRPEKLLRHDPA